MSQTPPPSITPAPPAPQRGVRSTFSNLVDAFVLWLVNAVTQFGAVATNVYNNAVDAYNNAVIAQAQSQAAIAAVNAVPWTPGSYVASPVADVRYSPIDGKTYRCYVAVTGSTDPSADPTHWSCASAGPFPYLHVRDQKSANTPGGLSGGVNAYGTRVLNTTVGTNTIAGSSLGSNQVALPAGTYEMMASAPAYRVNAHKLSLYNVTDSADILVGSSSHDSTTGNDSVTVSEVKGRFTLASAKTISLRHWTSQTSNTSDFGVPTNNGQAEVYASLQLWKIA